MSMVVPLTIRGFDTAGHAFKENTWTIAVNKQGAKIATFHELALGAPILIENPVLGRTAKARVIRVGEKRFPEDPFEIGVELTEAQNVWGVKFPPEDWQKTVATGTSGRWPENAGEPAAAQRGTRPASPEALNTAEAFELEAAPTATLAETSAHPENFSQFNLAMAALSRFAKQAEAAAEPGPEPLERTPANRPHQVDFQTQASLQETVERLDDKASIVHSLEQHLNALVEFTRASRAELESLLSKFQEVHRDWQSQSDNIQRKIQEATRQALQSAFEELNQKVREEMESACSNFVVETRQRIQEEATTALETFNRDAGLRGAKKAFQQDLQKLQDRVQEEVVKAGAKARQSWQEEVDKATETLEGRIARRADAAVDSIHLAADDSAGKLQLACQKIEADFTARTEESQKQLAAMSTSSLAGFQRYTEALLEGFQFEVQKTLRESQEKAKKEFSERLQKETDDANQQAAAQIKSKSEQVAKEASDAVYKQVGVGAVVLKDWVDQASHRLETNSQNSLEAFQKHIEEISKTALEKHRMESELLVEDLHSRLQQAARVLQGKSAEGIDTKLT